MTDAERDRRLLLMLEQYERQGWQPSGYPERDRRQEAILGLMARAADRAAVEQQSPESLARAECWRERVDLFKAAAS